MYLVEEGNARFGEACRLVPLRERVEGRVFGARETTEGVVESCLRCLLSVPLLLLDSLMARRRSRDVPMWTAPLMVLAWTLEYALPNATLDVVEVMASLQKSMHQR
jgi:hypothetical protein